MSKDLTVSMFMEIPLYRWTYDPEVQAWVRGQELSVRLHEPITSTEQAVARLAEAEARTAPFVEEITTPDIDQVPTLSGLDQTEEVVALLLGHAWDQWQQLKPSREENSAFLRAINDAQRVIAARAHMNRFADFWRVDAPASEEGHING